MKSKIVRIFPRAVRVAAIASVSLVALLFAACNLSAPGGGSPGLSKSLTGASAPAVATSFTILANAAVTVTGPVGSVIGDVGTFLATPPGAVTQTPLGPPGPITGSIHIGDPTSIAAYNNFLAAYASLAPKTTDVITATLTGTLDGQILGPGLYYLDAVAKTGVLTLNGSATDTWIFKVPSGALTGTNFTVVMAGTATSCNVIWWVDAAATMTDSVFKGTILAGAGITLTRGTFDGNAYAGADGVGDVTVTGTTVTGCEAPVGIPASICRDFVTGGGRIGDKSDGKHSWQDWDKDKVTFGVSGGIKNGRFWGQLSFNDHGKGVRIKSTEITNYRFIDPVTREIDGIARIGHDGTVTFKVVVQDNGEPGRGKDTFSIVLSNGYTASGTLTGGNIQLHSDCTVSKGDHHDRDNDRENYRDKDEQDGNNNCDRDR